MNLFWIVCFESVPEFNWVNHVQNANFSQHICIIKHTEKISAQRWRKGDDEMISSWCNKYDLESIMIIIPT